MPEAMTILRTQATRCRNLCRPTQHRRPSAFSHRQRKPTSGARKSRPRTNGINLAEELIWEACRRICTGARAPVEVHKALVCSPKPHSRAFSLDRILNAGAVREEYQRNKKRKLEEEDSKLNPNQKVPGHPGGSARAQLADLAAKRTHRKPPSLLCPTSHCQISIAE